MIKGCVQLGAFPDLQGATFDICTVDFVSRALVAIMTKKECLNHSFHMVSEQGFDLRKFYETAKAFGYPVELIPYAEWRSRLFQSQANGTENALHSVMAIFTEDYPARLQHPTYDRSNVIAALQNTPITQTAIESLLPLYFSYLVRSHFLSTPQNQDTTMFQKWITNHNGATVELITRTNRNK
jgi:thioester reductase-like protein